jgi:penicillin-binding protein 1A
LEEEEASTGPEEDVKFVDENGMPIEGDVAPGAGPAIVPQDPEKLDEEFIDKALGRSKKPPADPVNNGDAAAEAETF